MNAALRLAVTALAFAVGFAGVWLYVADDSEPVAEPTPTISPAPTPAPAPPIFVPGIACDGCEGSD